MIRNFSWALRGHVFYAASQWGLLIVLAKLGGPEVVGRYTLGLAVTAPIVLFADLQLRSLLASDVNSEYHFREYVCLRASTNSLAFLIICVVVLTVGYTAQQATVILLIGLAKILESSSDIMHGLMQKNERMDLVGISKVIKGIVVVPVFGFVFYLTGSLIVGMVSLILIWLSMFVFVDCQNIGKLFTRVDVWKYGMSSWKRWPWRRLVALAWRALPLGIASMLMSYNHAVPRYFLEIYHGEAVLGYFSAIAYLSATITITIEALGQTALPRLAKYYGVESRKYWRLLLKLSAAALSLGGLGMVGSIVTGKPVVSFVYKPEYGQFTDILVLVMVLGTSEALCSVLGVGLTVARMLRFQVVVLIIVLSTGTVTAWWLVPQYAMKGAVWASMAAAAIWLALYAVGISYLRWNVVKQ